MSNTNQLRLSYIVESAFGVPTTGNLKDLRVTGESLKQASQIVRSQEIRSDRQTVDVIRTEINAEGDINVESSWGAFDDLFAANLFTSLTWASAVTVGPIATISAAAADNSFNDSGSGFGSFAVNQWVKVSGFATAANNGYFKILTKTTGKITVSGGVLVNESVGPSVTIKMGEQIINGTTLNSFAIEKKFTDLTNKFAKYLGMCPAGFKQSIKADQIITGSFSFLGKSETSTSATIGTGYTTAPTNEVMAGVDDVFAILEGTGSGQSTMADVNMIDFTVNNNLRKRLRIGTLGPFSIGSGSFEVGGDFEIYFSDETLMNKYLNFTQSALAIVIVDGAGKSYVLDWPAVKFSDGQRIAGGQNQDIMASMKFETLMNSAEGITMRIARF